MRRGDLDEAERIAREAEAVLPGKKRMPWIVIGMIEKLRGNDEEAIRALDHAKTIVMGHIPAMTRRADAAIDKELAVLHAELGRGDDALALIAGAESEFAGDPKLTVSLDAAAALVHALGHKRDPALARIASAEEGRASAAKTVRPSERCSTCSAGPPSCSTSPGGRRVSSASISIAGPILCSTPTRGIILADAGGGSATSPRGADCDRKAASTRFGTLWERLARERLAAEGAAV